MKIDLYHIAQALAVAMLLSIANDVFANDDIQGGVPYIKAVPVEQCPVYTGFAKAIMEMRNAGKSETETVPEVMRMITACTQNKACPLKEGLQTERVLAFIGYVYSIHLGVGEEIDVEASTYGIEKECEAKAAIRKQEEEHPPLKPDQHVPFSGTQIES